MNHRVSHVESKEAAVAPAEPREGELVVGEAAIVETGSGPTPPSEITLERLGRLAGIGRMTSGIAHDLKNLLNPISLHLQFIAHALKRKDLDEIATSTAEMRALLDRSVHAIERLRAYSRSEEEEPEQPLPWNEIVEDAIELARPGMTTRAGRLGSFRVELAEAPSVLARRNEMLGVLVALLVNAIEATPPGGEVTVTTGSVDGGAFARVVDSGPGIPRELLLRVFEPFFTTKESQGATGLGLSTAQSAVARQGGSLRASSREGGGSIFTVWLPAA